MQRFRATWKRIPDSPRRVLTFILGVLLVILAGLIGALPGPGGTILFLLGIAVLATEFAWAERLRDYLLDLLHRAGRYVREHPQFSGFLFAISLAVILFCIYIFYTKIL
jgi:hypothetical protein